MSETKINLAKAYDEDAHRRSQSTAAEWKVRERGAFAELLRQEGKTAVLEIGAGTGRDSRFFKDCGYEVTSTDLSQEMVRYCREQGLNAMVMDFYNLEFADESFEAVYALNCLLHVPKNELGGVLLEIRRVLKRGGIFYMGVYGGRKSEEIWDDDWCEPKRLFSFYTDDAIQAAVKEYFDVEDFHAVPLEAGKPHFQSLIARKR
ncbi:hypothetical protein SD70_17470 [Gordoniibacillus kamchatkensis]|uniref:Methyltransferase type 11 domain-containing protein n=1 Tax=Gordoniibacillus kamchatkensis TaxID=1590651 RepID=A0ABR5AFQ8_9BACL|nr:hypothetical protein SD70_17470 [Paenibacillus sp. VKM B-2647]